MEFIDLKTQQIKIRKSIEDRIHKVLNHGQYIMGPEIEELEEKLATYVGTKYCVSNSSGTDALLLAMMSLGIGQGDEVITTPFTFFATGEMITLLGAKAVWADIDPETYNLDPKSVEKKITSKTKAILPVSLYGLCPDFDSFSQVSNRYNIPLIEDAAQSFGATYKGKRSCSFSKISCASFFPSKPLGGYGDSGACFTNDEALAEKMRQLRIHGQKSRYNRIHIGINGRMDTLQAAILLSKFEIFDEEVKLRDEIGTRYTELLPGKLKTQKIPHGQTSVFAQFTVEVENRSKVQMLLKEKNIPTAIHYPVPLHLQPAYSLGLDKKGDYPYSESAAERVLSLPMHPYLSKDDQKFVVDSLLSSLS